MLAQASPWHAHALQRTAAGLAEPLSVPARMEWTTRPGQGPGADVLGPDLRGKRLLELGCGPGHNAAHLATRHGAHVTGIDLVGLQVRRARSHYGRLNNLTFVAGHALHCMHASDKQFDAIYSVFGAIGLVAPELLLPAIAQRLTPGRVLAFSVPHPQRGGRSPSGDDRRPRRDFVTLPNRTRLPIARWEFDTDRWERHLSRAGELFGLQLRHVDLLHATVSVEQQIQQTAKHGVYVCPPKTARSHRTVPLPRMAVDAMKAHLRDFPADGPEGWIFTAPQGGPVVYTHFMDGSWRPACAKAGIPKGTGPHALRHHYASLLTKHGESVKTVSERLSHTNAAMTLNIYTHLWPDSEERTRAAVDKAYADQSADAQPQVDEAA